MTVLIADDEHLVRYGLKSMLDELNLGLRVVAEAATGDDLVTLVLKHRPDLAFVDIRMPGMNGLAAVRKARKAGVTTKWIILSSHAEFDYAAEALQLGVCSYLLKPAGPAQLFEAVAPVLQLLAQERAEACARFEQELIVGLGSTEAGAGPEIAAGWAGLFRLETGPGASHADRTGFAPEALRLLRAGASGVRTGGLRTAVWAEAGGRIAAAAAWHPEDTAARDAAAAWRDGAAGLARLSSGLQLRLTAFFTGTLASWDEVRSGLGELRDALKWRVVLGTGAVHDLPSLARRLPEPREASARLAEASEAAASAREQGDPASFEERLARFEAEVALRQVPAAQAEAAVRYLAFRLGEDAPLGGPADLVRWLADLAVRSRAQAPEVRRQADVQARIVEKVDQYLRDRLSGEVRVPELASSLGLTPNYLSTVYRQHAGLTISERLAGLRLDLARDLLSRPGSQVKEVAAAVGYQSPRHFARLYQERFGRSPSGR